MATKIAVRQRVNGQERGRKKERETRKRSRREGGNHGGLRKRNVREKQRDRSLALGRHAQKEKRQTNGEWTQKGIHQQATVGGNNPGGGNGLLRQGGTQAAKPLARYGGSHKVRGGGNNEEI